MLEVVVSGLVTGWAIAIPVGAIAAFLVTLTARTSFRVGSAAALGVASIDGIYATAAVLGGAALSAAIAPIAEPLKVVSGIVLLGVAVVTVRQTLRSTPEQRRDAKPMTPRSAYLLFLGLTAVNPATVVYFAAVVLGNQGLVSTPLQGAAFVLAAFAASASWQLTLAGGGAALGRFVTSPRGHVVTGVVSGLVIAGLALWTMLG
ncbi:MAG: LysE family transporter [Nocardioidaceae bacterium]|nr:LysE family transporter [Nocardioidaceae bacterium]